MEILEIDKNSQIIKVSIPLTNPTGKIRVKNRDAWYGYGEPFPTRQKAFNNKSYIEWQISYDAEISNKEKLQLSTIPNKTFQGANGKIKALYELSEYLYYFHIMGVINKKEIEELLDDINKINNNNLIENNKDLLIERSVPNEYILEGLTFQKSIVKYPLLLYQLSSFNIIIEIIIKEKQRAVGIQPMLYVSFPIAKLQSENDKLIGRCANENEKAILILDKSHKDFILQIFKIFALLSKNHKTDIINIIKLILSE